MRGTDGIEKKPQVSIKPVNMTEYLLKVERMKANMELLSMEGRLEIARQIFIEKMQGEAWKELGGKIYAVGDE